MTLDPQCHGDSDKRPKPAQLRAKHLTSSSPVDSLIPLIRFDTSPWLSPPFAQNRLKLRTSFSNQRQPCGEPLPPRDADGPNDPMSLTNPPSSGSISARARTANLKRSLQSVDGKYLILGCCVACSLCWKA